MKRVEKARAKVRRHVWAQLAAVRLPPSKVAGTDLGETVVLDVDATLVTVHSEKESAAATFKGGFGYHPIGVWCDNTQEMLAAMLRPGNAGSNTTADHIAVLTAAIAQVPAGAPQEAAGPRGRRRRLARAAGLADRPGRQTRPQRGVFGRVRGHRPGPRPRSATVPARAWTPAVDADGDVRDGGDVAEVTDLLDLTRWPAGMRVIIRRERPHPGAQLSLFEEADGWRYQAVATNTRVGQLAFLEARHRAHARVEDRIRHAKDSGLGRFPSREFAINQAWLQVVTHRRRPDRLAAPPRAARRPSRRASRRRCATGSCTSPPASPAAPDDDGCGCPRPGRGPSSSRPPSTRSPRSQHRPERRSPTLTAHHRNPRRPAPQRHAATRHTLHRRHRTRPPTHSISQRRKTGGQRGWDCEFPRTAHRRRSIRRILREGWECCPP